MNYYLIWTDKGWLRTPTYCHAICSGVPDLFKTMNITQDIRCAYKLGERQVKDCLAFLHRYGVASWAIECKEDFHNELIDNLEKKRAKSN